MLQVRRELANIYHTTFTHYSVQCYTKVTQDQGSEYGEGTLYTIQVSTRDTHHTKDCLSSMSY